MRKGRLPPIAPHSVSIWFDSKKDCWRWSVHNKDNAVREGASSDYGGAFKDARIALGASLLEKYNVSKTPLI
jgi:hypothetical protein